MTMHRRRGQAVGDDQNCIVIPALDLFGIGKPPSKVGTPQVGRAIRRRAMYI